MNRTPLLVFDKKGADLIQFFTKKVKKGLKSGLCSNTDVKKHVFGLVHKYKSPYLCNILKTIFLP